MNAAREQTARWTSCALAGALLIGSATNVLAEATDLTFPVLQIGTRTYTNVTVTTKAKDYVFLLHSAGMSNFKVTELSPEVLEQLGYTAPKPRTNTVAKQIAQQAMATVESPQVQQVGKGIEAMLPSDWKAQFGQFKSLPLPAILIGIVGVVLFLYLFYCYCLSLICKKAGRPGGILVWLPILQIFPALRAADMSFWWLFLLVLSSSLARWSVTFKHAGISGWLFLAILAPVLNLVFQIVWSFKITRARGKPLWVGFLLLLPILNVFAFLYLAFSSDGTEEAPKQEAKITRLKLQSA